MMIAGSAYNFLPYAAPRITPAIQWVQDAAGYWSGSDRGAAQDIYETTVGFAGLEATLDALQQTLQANREGLTLSSFTTTGQELFGPEVNYTGSISATVTEPGTRNHFLMNRVSQLQIGFRALSPALIGTTPSLASLRLQPGWDGDQEWTATKAFSLNQTASYADHRADVGRLVGTFIQTPAESRAILAYLLTTARANTITLPTFPGVTYPFGRPRGAGPFNCVIPKWEISRKGLNRWTFKIQFSEAA